MDSQTRRWLGVALLVGAIGALGIIQLSGPGVFSQTGHTLSGDRFVVETTVPFRTLAIIGAGLIGAVLLIVPSR